MSHPRKGANDDVQYMNLANSINNSAQYMNLANSNRDNEQYMNLPNSNRDNEQYMNLPNSANDGVQYMNLLNTTNNDVRYMNVSNPMALRDDDESNDQHQRKSGRLVSVRSYVFKVIVTMKVLCSSSYNLLHEVVT